MKLASEEEPLLSPDLLFEEVPIMAQVPISAQAVCSQTLKLLSQEGVPLPLQEMVFEETPAPLQGLPFSVVPFSCKRCAQCGTFVLGLNIVRRAR